MAPGFVFQKSKSFICLIFIYIKSFHPPAGGLFLNFKIKQIEKIFIYCTDLFLFEYSDCAKWTAGLEQRTRDSLVCRTRLAPGM